MSATIVEFAIPLVLIVLDYAFNRSGLIEAVEVRTIFNPTREDSLINWVSSLQELAIGVVAALIYAHGRITQSGSPWMRRGWLFIALLFAYVSIDDGMSVHERVGTALANWNPDGVVDLYPSYPWQLIFVPLFGAAGLVMLFVLYGQLSWGQLLFFCVGVGMIMFAQSLDFIEGSSIVLSDAMSHFQKAIEEAIEMSGMALIFFAFARHLVTVTRGRRLRFV